MGLFAFVSLLLTASAQDRLAYYADRDADGYGDPGTVRYATGPTPGYTRRAGDCNDRDDMTNPNAFEFCGDGDDDDCDGHVDECDVSLDDAALVIGSSAAGASVQGTLTVTDINGDGTGDLVVGSYPWDRQGVIYLLYGPLSGTVLIDDAVTITTPVSGSFGAASGGGDADGDGFDDLLVGAPLHVPSTNYLSTTYLFLGPVTSDGDLRDADAVLTNRETNNSFGLTLLVTPDQDGDGYADVVVGSPDGDGTYEGAVYVAPGASIGTVPLVSDATYIYEGNGVDELGAAIADPGDTNGDGIHDLAICAGYDGEVFLVEGGLTPGRYRAADVATTTIEGFRWDGYVTGFQPVDYDGDGAMDLVAGDWLGRSSTGESTGGAYAFVAPWADAMDLDDAMAAWEWTAATAAGAEHLGRSLAAGDFDGDEETDLIIGAYACCGHDWPGLVFFQWGVASGVVDVGSLPYVTGVDRADLGVQMAVLPDWNGDGISEVAIEAYGSLSSSGSYDDVIYGLFSGVSY